MTLTAEPFIVSTDPILSVTSCIMTGNTTHMTLAIDTHTLLEWYQSSTTGAINLAKFFNEAVAEELAENQDFGQDPTRGDELYIFSQTPDGLIPCDCFIGGD
jgi:hypothetical protein